MFSRRDEDFPSHVSAFLGPVGLVFHVNSCGAAFDKHFGEFHDGGKTSVAGIGIGDDGTKEVDEGGVGAVGWRQFHSCGTLFAVMEALRHEQMFDLQRQLALYCS
jgi:hypothetical protein